jgi:hypothetical protein
MLNFYKLFGRGDIMGRKRFSPEQIIVKLREGEYSVKAVGSGLESE